METLGKRKLFSFVENGRTCESVSNVDVRSKRGLNVETYEHLVVRIAELSFYNPEYVLLFRGQRGEYFNRVGHTAIKPSIFRSLKDETAPVPPQVLEHRYELLRQADELVSIHFHFSGKERIRRYRVLRWAIIQHYEICDTPLLDVTHSLRVAASFATMDKSATEPVLYVLAVPSLSGSITTSSEQGIQTIRLSSICPHEARRPYFQEGYLLGEYPDLVTMDDKQNYETHEIDFGLRLLGKFHLARHGFWSEQFPFIPYEALCPDKGDPLIEFKDQIKKQLR